MLLPQIVKCSASYRARQDVTFIVDLVILGDTQPEDLERPQTPNTCLNYSCIQTTAYFP